MTHLLDTNICSAHMRRPAGLAHRLFQYAGRLAISTVVLAELYAGAYLLAKGTGSCDVGEPSTRLFLVADYRHSHFFVDGVQASPQPLGLLTSTPLQQGDMIGVEYQHGSILVDGFLGGL